MKGETMEINIDDVFRVLRKTGFTMEITTETSVFEKKIQKKAISSVL